MKNVVFLLSLITIFTGCLKTTVPYTSSIVNNIDNNQYIENKECIHLIGPFPLENELNIDTIINNTIVKAQKQGMYGEELVNINITEDIFTFIVYTKLCLEVKGNLVE